jgi:hypothetical protein
MVARLLLYKLNPVPNAARPQMLEQNSCLHVAHLPGGKMKKAKPMLNGWVCQPPWV